MMGFDVDLTGDYHTVVQPLDHPEITYASSS